MLREIYSVAVIGAGISGVVSDLHLKAAGLTVTVYERSSAAGGVWVHDERRPLEPDYPSMKPSVADFIPSEENTREGSADPLHSECQLDLKGDENAKVELLHAPPGPCYEGLKNNVSTALLKLKNHSWVQGTEDFVSHRSIKEYIQAAAKKSCSVHFYNTRVEKVRKEEGRWRIESTTLTRLGSGRVKRSRRIQDFDAVVVASGHYHACKVPDIPGLKDWKAAWPDRVTHSKSYRSPKDYESQNVLLVGAGVSSTDIAREIEPFARKIYQVSRGGAFDLPVNFLPDNAIRVGEISFFETPDRNHNPGPQNGHISAHDQAIPSSVSLKDGTVLLDIHSVILCTGYHCSYPFLRHLHRDSIPCKQADDEALVTDGTQMHNLHKDIFYIPDSTLSFVGVPYYGATFTLFEFQAIAIAAVYSRKARLPSLEAMRQEYQERVQRKGYGRGFHSVRDEEVAYVNDLVSWVNRDGKKVGAEPVEGHTAKWHEVNSVRLEKLRERMAMRRKVGELDASTW